MSLPKLYIETTIPSYLVARPSNNLRTAGHQLATDEWWHGHRHEYALFVSRVVLRECGRGDAAMAGGRLALLNGIPLLEATEESDDLAARLLSGGLIPARAVADAFHIAIAAVHGMDFLLTWNCTHIHNLSIMRRVERICSGAGYACPVICSPDDFLPTSLP